jgi:ATP-binding cassette subfamily F protein 3
MILLSVRELTRQFDAEPVFRNVGFTVRPGERIGLVGTNGSGKTTLLNILVGLDHADSGEIEKHSATEIALLEQETDFAPNQTLIEEARSGLAHLYQLQTEAEELADDIAVEQDSEIQKQLQKRFDHIQQELHRLDAYNIDHRVDEVLTGLGFQKEEYERPLRSFSGGQQNRALLARMLLRAPNLMLLDEPTNHLDIEATEWLEAYLSRCKQGIILVSHDRYFLDRVTTRILELSGGSISDYPGNFTAYWNQREERNKVAHRTWEKQQEFIAKTEDFIRRNKYGQKHAQASDRVKKLERLERVELPTGIQTSIMQFGEPTRTGDWVIDAVDLSKGFAEPLFTDFTLRVNRGDRIGIFGPNGSGKTTLLRTILGELEPDSGSVRYGTGVKIGYYDQQLESVDPKLTAVDAVRPPHWPDATPGELRDLLARFGIRGDLGLQRVGSMSGGEKSKVALAKVAAQNVNLLVLDEPTNHLDLWARDSLEEALKAFDGTLLFVSHDRYFLDRIASSVIVLGVNEWRFYEGNYSDFVQFVRNQKLESASVPPKPGTSKRQSEPNSKRTGEKSPKRQRKYPYCKVEVLEEDIARQEERLQSLQGDLANPAVHRDGARIKQTKQSFEETKQRLAQLYEHWEEAVELN